MSTPTFAEKDSAVILAEALARYKAATVSAENPSGVTLQPADPRRIFLQTVLLFVSQGRSLIDYSGKQNLLRYVSNKWIDALAELWGLTRKGAEKSTCTQRFTASAAGVLTIPAGKRVTDGTNVWEVISTTTSAAGATYVDAKVRCTVAGKSSNGVAIGQIDTLVDDIPGIASTSNVTATISGADAETLDAFRERIRSEPEQFSVAGPRGAYQALAKAASASVADAVALGPDDVGEMSGYDPPTAGEVHVLIIEGARDDAGALSSVIPDPTAGLIDEVQAYLSGETVRPLGDYLTVMAPQFVSTDLEVRYFISGADSDNAADIQTRVEDAYEAFKLWQTSKIGRDINPSRLIADLVAAGAKRVEVSDMVFTRLLRDECCKIGYDALTYGGLEDE